MIVKFILLISLMFSCVFAKAEDSREIYLNYLTNKTLEDFEKGVELYNTTKSANAPAIIKLADDNYNLAIKKDNVRFTAINYLQGELYVNGRLVKKSDILLNKKTTLIDLLLSTANASAEDLSAENTKVLMMALEDLDNKLEDIGMFCLDLFDCPKEVKENNLKKILSSLNAKNEECSNQRDSQKASIKNFYDTGKYGDVLHSILKFEFIEMKNFYDKILKVDVGSTSSFLKDKFGITTQYGSCMGIMLSKTIADGSDIAAQGVRVIVSGGLADLEGLEKEKIVNSAKEVCLKFDQLKTCIFDIEKNVATINSLKREKKGNDSGRETLPDVSKVLSR